MVGAAADMGIDHWIFLICTGVFAGSTERRLLTPTAFVAASALGGVAHAGGWQVIALDFVLAATAALAGVLAALARAAPVGASLSLFLLAGVYHGFSLAPGRAGDALAHVGAVALIQCGAIAAAAAVASAGWRIGGVSVTRVVAGASAGLAAARAAAIAIGG